MLPKGAFLVFGPELPPEVHLLGPIQLDQFNAGGAVVRTPKGRAQLYAETFSHGAEAAIPAWSEAAMVAIAEGYSGPYSAAIRGIAAAIALGMPFGRDDDSGPGDPNSGARLIPEGPLPYNPGNANQPTIVETVS